MHIVHVVGARPNFMKAAPVLAALANAAGVQQTLVHTGQHYDANMSDVFFQQLEMPAPDLNLGVGSDSHAVQTAAIMAGFEPVVMDRRPDLVLVYGDVNSTMAAALVCSKLQIRVGHVEAGLRSHDRTMPEEINRLITDQLSDLLFTPSADADENLQREGIKPARIHLVGNVMIDTLVRLLPRCAERRSADLIGPYALVTLHRPSNVDDGPWLRALLLALADLSHDVDVVFPVHPRTRQRIADLGLQALSDGHLRLLDPKPYLDFLALQQGAAMVITDSGGIQEESTFLGIPCLTLRQNTERPVTVSLGTNVLIGRDIPRLQTEIRRILAGEIKKTSPIPLWDGHAAERIAQVVLGRE
ncbi:MAG: UDP-N-acetylglucosamine 2-epimerase (non-hydrolyzing) [Acidobacteriia bacterium]|nr:UDP-N-acetylglucosamine 2-epimerase (non-hydrolyzing) [Terriglobia bacterium]